MTKQELAKVVKDWRKNHNDIRFGQNLWNMFNANGLWETPEANSLFFMRDEDLAKMIISYTESYQSDTEK